MASGALLPLACSREAFTNDDVWTVMDPQDSAGLSNSDASLCQALGRLGQVLGRCRCDCQTPLPHACWPWATELVSGHLEQTADRCQQASALGVQRPG